MILEKIRGSPEDVKKALAELAPLIDGEIEKYMPRKSDVENFYDGMWYAIGTGGKRIRPVMCLAACEAFGGDWEKALPTAAACELMHNYFLIHDDIEDGDTVRRNQPATWVKYGLDHGINIGDGMIEVAYKAILSSVLPSETIFRLLNIFTDTVLRTGEGQAMEMTYRKRRDADEKWYMGMITLKTAHYLTAPITSGAIIAGADDNVVKKIIEYGMAIGPAFQIQDDVIDLTEGKGRGEIGSDIKEGKRSLLVVHCASVASGEERERMYGILDKPREKTTKEDIEYAIGLFKKYRSFEYARKRQAELLEKSKKALVGLKPEARSMLELFAEFIVERKA